MWMLNNIRNVLSWLNNNKENKNENKITIGSREKERYISLIVSQLKIDRRQ